MNDDTMLREQLLEAETRREAGEVSDDEFRAIERDLLTRIRGIRDRRVGGATAAAGPIDMSSTRGFQIEASVTGDFYEPRRAARSSSRPNQTWKNGSRSSTWCRRQTRNSWNARNDSNVWNPNDPNGPNDPNDSNAPSKATQTVSALTYAYCLVRSARRPSLRGVPAGMPGGDAVRLFEVSGLGTPSRPDTAVQHWLVVAVRRMRTARLCSSGYPGSRLGRSPCAGARSRDRAFSGG